MQAAARIAASRATNKFYYLLRGRITTFKCTFDHLLHICLI